MTIAFDQAEVTIFFEKVKYRDANGAEKEAFSFKPLASVKYASLGAEGGILTPLTISWEGSAPPESDIGGISGVRFFLEPARVEAPNELHSLGWL